jgi:hypothetical protein
MEHRGLQNAMMRVRRPRDAVGVSGDRFENRKCKNKPIKRRKLKDFSIWDGSKKPLPDHANAPISPITPRSFKTLASGCKIAKTNPLSAGESRVLTLSDGQECAPL